jgi:hypothetical protein
LNDFFQDEIANQKYYLCEQLRGTLLHNELFLNNIADHKKNDTNAGNKNPYFYQFD